MITFDEALRFVCKSVFPLEAEPCAISELAGRVLAEDIVARVDNPRFSNSSMDGFAVRAADIHGASRENPVSLEIVSEIFAGNTPNVPIRAGQAARIMTGAPLPNGADAVVMVEDAKCEGARVWMFHDARAGENLRTKGADIKEGEVIVAKGQRIGAGEIFALASQGISETKVYRRPKVAVIATGDELTAPGDKLKDGCIYDACGFGLSAQIQSAGAVPYMKGICPDDEAALTMMINDCKSADCTIIAGGVSMGERDLARKVLNELGFREIFWRVAMKPGKPLLFGTLEGKPVFGLPGNPISSMVTFELFVSAAIKKMTGLANRENRFLQARLMNDAPMDEGREQFLFGHLSFDKSGACVSANNLQASAYFKPAISSNCLIRIPTGEGVRKADNIVYVLPCQSFNC